MNKIIIFQNAHEIRLARNLFGDSLKDFIFIAWTPSAVDGLHNEGEDFICVEDISKKNYDWLGVYKRWKNYGTWCRHVDGIISNVIPEFERFKIKSFVYHFMHKRALYINYLSEIDSLFEIEKLLPEKIYYFSYPVNEFSPLSRIIDQVTLIKDWKEIFVPLNSDEHVTRSWSLANLFITYAVYNTSILKIIKKWIVRYFKNLFRGNKSESNIVSILTSITFGFIKTKNPKVFVFATNEDEINPLLHALKNLNKKIDFIFLDEIHYTYKHNLNVPTEMILSKIKENNDPNKFLEYRGIDLFPLVSSEIERILREDLVVFYNNVLCFLELNKKLNFKLVISAYELAVLEAIFQQCEVLKIPRIICLHGGTVGVFKAKPPLFDYFRDGGLLHYHFCYTNAIKDYQDNLVKKFGGSVSYVAVGSSHYRKIKAKTNNQRSNSNDSIKICLVLKRILNEGDGLREDTKSYKITNDIVNILKNNPNIELDVKCHGIEEHTSLELFSNIKNNKFKNISIISSKVHFYNIIQNYDLIILNCLGTAFWEAASTNLPILLFADPRIVCIDEAAKQLIRKRSTIVESAEQYYARVMELGRELKKSILFNNEKMTNSEFFNEYCCERDSSPPVNGANWIQNNIINKK